MGEKCYWRPTMRKFIRLNITSEGQTEEYFVKKVLATHLGHYNISTDVRSVLTRKDQKKHYRGGLKSYQKAKKDILMWLKEDNNSESRFSTMFDLYALPNDFPKFKEAKKITDPYKKIEFLENAFKQDINDIRFFPYLQLHEFEALILSQPQELKWEYFDRSGEIEKLIKLSNDIGNPELINDNPETAPSKRILKLIPEYDKANIGPEITDLIGIETLKQKCKHFNDWIIRLEKMTQ